MALPAMLRQVQQLLLSWRVIPIVLQTVGADLVGDFGLDDAFDDADITPVQSKRNKKGKTW